ncbi:MAG: insulinase family protein [Acidobacteriota bacterium]
MISFCPGAARLAVFLFAIACAAPAGIQLDQYASTVHEFKLANGLTVVLIEDHGAPVVTACLTAKGGYADDPIGMRGLASLVPSLLEQGPEQLGSRNLTEERAALKAMNAAFAEWKSFESKPGASAMYDRMQTESKLKLAIRVAEGYAKPQFSVHAMEYYGADPFRATSTADLIQWSARLPSNRIDAFLLLYGEWLRQPIPRMLYFNKDQRSRQFEQAQSSQDALLRHAVLPLAYGPYRYGLPEWEPAEMERLQYSDVETYLKSRLSASNLVLTLAGDLTLESARAMAEKYLSKVPTGAPIAFDPPPPVEPKEVRAAPPRELQTAMLVGYRRPLESDPDDPVMDVIEELMLEGPASRFRTEFMATYQVLQSMVPIASLPGARHGGLMAVIFPYHPAKNPKEWTDLIAGFFEDLGKTSVPAESVDRARNSIESRLLGILSDPNLAAHHIGRMGGWQPVVELAKGWVSVTPADVQRVAAKYIRPELRVVLQPGYTAGSPAPAVSK